MFGLEELKKTRYYQEVAEEEREKGRVEGHAEGLSEGRTEAKLEAIPGLVEAGLSAEKIAQILDLDMAVVRQAVAAL